MVLINHDVKRRKEQLLERLHQDIPANVTFALQEDLGGSINIESDISGQLLAKNQLAFAKIITREDGIFVECVGSRRYLTNLINLFSLDGRLGMAIK